MLDNSVLFNVNNMKKIKHENFDDCFDLYAFNNDDIHVLKQEISKSLKVIDYLKDKELIPKEISFNVDSIIINDNDNYKTFLEYTPFTPTGKLAKCMGIICYEIKDNDLCGSIRYYQDRSIIDYYMNFNHDKKEYSIKVKKEEIDSIDDIKLQISDINENAKNPFSSSINIGPILDELMKIINDNK